MGNLMKMIPLFRELNGQKPTRMGGTYLYQQYVIPISHLWTTNIKIKSCQSWCLLIRSFWKTKFLSNKYVGSPLATPIWFAKPKYTWGVTVLGGKYFWWAHAMLCSRVGGNTTNNINILLIYKYMQKIQINRRFIFPAFITICLMPYYLYMRWAF